MTIITNAHTFRQFATAGRATFTVQSQKTGARFTYRMRKAKDDGPARFHIGLLTGANNETDYNYVGTYRADGRWFPGRDQTEAPSMRAIAFVCEKVLASERFDIPAGLEIRHEGRCGRCARLLTTPESIDRGIGPECAGKL
jgi:hypothetical protein